MYKLKQLTVVSAATATKVGHTTVPLATSNPLDRARATTSIAPLLVCAADAVLR